MSYPEPQPCTPPVISPVEWIVRDCLEAMRERGVASRATPQELLEIAHGKRDIRTVLL